MTDRQHALLLLIKSALTGDSYALPTDFDAANTFADARTHGVTALAYYGALGCGVDARSDVMRDAFARVCRELLVGERQTAELSRLTAALDEHSIDYMPLKGAHLKKLYPKPEMRRMSDADVLVKTEQYDRIRPIMLALGYTEGVESDHEYNWQKDSTHIELHKRLIPSYNKDYYAYFGDGWRLAKKKEDKGFEYAMSAEDEMVYIFTHFAKHYRDAGIGVRHLTDLWVYRRTNPSLDEDYVRAELEKLQLADFYANILATLAAWFEDTPFDDTTDFITEFVFASGEFGKKGMSVVSDALKHKKTGKNAAALKRAKVLHALFTPYDEMCKKYPILKRAPVLLPFVWCVHFVRRVLTKGKVKTYIGTQLSVTDSDVDAYQKSLNFVGLDFNFGGE